MASIALPPPLSRIPTTIIPPGEQTPNFLIGHSKKSYRHQYSNIYFIRLRNLRKYVEENAHRRWTNVSGNPVLIPRVLEVEKGRLCYIVGTVYMDMPLKPNVIEDIARDQSLPALPPPLKFCSPQDNVMLEDESGRIRLVGDLLKETLLVTGIIIGALGMETPNGDFEVIDLCYPEMAPQPTTVETHADDNGMDVDGQDGPPENSSADAWIAVVSGLDFGSLSPADAQVQILTEYLTGECSNDVDQVSAAQICRLIIAGDSLSVVSSKVGEPVLTLDEKRSRRFGVDNSTFSPHPVLSLSDALKDSAGSIPIHILPGESDPSGSILPQQPFPQAMFGQASQYQTFSCETNPVYLTIASGESVASSSSKLDPPQTKRNVLINSGQPLNDMFKYLSCPPNTRLSILEATLKWRHIAPTAPDTLWCHPYFAEDPFLITETPDIYIVGGQKRFRTKLVRENQVSSKFKDITCRIIMVPRFADTGILVLVNLRTLAVKCVHFSVCGMSAGGKAEGKENIRAHSPVEPMPSEPKSSFGNEFL